ncbi:MAG: glucose-1-phosphate adenylyltransferase subunit GlgD [Schwartzia sp.]|nr:glucose-1-phosphate adenylyltransferase subunit GlgD [Schwartzia sp. (in: firmicutes)]
MKNVMGIVNLQAQEELLSALTEQRPLASLPFGGRYRLIDFPMSCMVNSGIRNVGVLLPEHSRSILDHLRSGKDWDLARHHKGLFYLPPVRRAHGEQGGDLQNMYSNLDFVDNSSEEYVLLAESSAVYNMDFTGVMETHFRLGADITMVTSASRCTDSGSGIVVRAARDGVVSDVCLHSDIKKGEQRSLGIYFMRKQLFVELVRQAVEHGGKDFRVDVLLRAAAGCRICAHQHTGYAWRICSVQAYYETNLALLHPEVWEGLFLREGAPIYTKVKDMAPVQYLDGAHVKNSIVANGCEISGKVENSILFRGVRVDRGAVVRNSIIMQNGVIGAHAEAECVITDKNVFITGGKVLQGARTYPIYIGKNKRV